VSHRSRRSPQRTLLVSLAIPALGEAVARVLWPALDMRRGLRLTHQIRRDWLEDLPPTRESSVVPLPYGLYWNRPNHVDPRGQLQTNSLGYRQGGLETVVPKPQGTFRVLVLGSSTTFSDAGAATPGEAWPAKLELALPGPPSGFDRVEVVNAGLNYALSAELLIHLIFVGLEIEPDMIVWEGPGNDWLPAAVGDASPDYRETRAPGVYPRPRFGEKSLVKRSYLARLLLALWLRATPSTGLVSLEPAGVNWSSEELLKRIRTDDFAGFRRNVELVADICSARAIPLLLVPFTTGSIERQLLSGSRSRAFLEAQEVAISRLNLVLAQVAAERAENTAFHSEPLVIPDDLYLDGTHLLPEGEAVKAAWVASAVADLTRDLPVSRK
jgi:lysophospholipase L1-like esterase